MSTYQDYPQVPALQISFHHLDLPLIASFFNFSIFIWAYAWLPVKLVLYSLTWTYLRVPVWLRFDFITHAYRIGLTPLMPNLLRFFENPDLFELSSSSRRSFWNFYRVQDPFSLYIPISNKKTYIWCNVSCNVWLCINEMSEHLNSFFFWIYFIPLSSFLVLTKCEMQISCP